MRTFNWGRYLLRVGKYIIYYAAIILALLAIVYYTSDHQEGVSLWSLLNPQSQRNLIILVVVFSMVYPFIGFTTKEVPSDISFNDHKEPIIKLITQCGYELIEDKDQQLVFRAARPLTRLTRLGEDKITLNYATATWVLTGLRKDIIRFASYISHYVRTQS